MFLNSIVYFRAIAIVLIVGAHCYGISDYTENSFSSRLIFNLTSGGTIVFVFLSGFLFHHIFYLKDRLGTFYLSRVKRLFVPYLILSILPILYRLKFESDFWSHLIEPDKTGVFYEFLYPFLLFLIGGDHLVAYWYIPFAMLLFLCYPLHVLFIKARRQNQWLIMFITLIIAVLVQRPEAKSLLIIQSLVYFTPAYLFGIFSSINRNFLIEKLRGKEIVLLLIFVLTIILQSYFEVRGNTHKPFFSFEGIDTILPQKLILCTFLLVGLNRFENVQLPLLSLLANTSFAIYFLHGYVLRMLYILKENLSIEIFEFPVVFFFLSWMVLIVTSIAIALLLRRISPKYSKYITGY